MKDSVFLVLSRSGVQRYRKTPPDLFMGEIAIKFNLEISDSWFNKVIPEGTVVVPDDAVLGDGLEIEFLRATDEQLEHIEKSVKVEIETRAQQEPA